MRQIVSSGSVKGIWVNREEILKKLKKICEDALKEFSEIKEIWLFGSFAKGEETGLSDIDLFIVAENQALNPVERIRPYFILFAERIKMSIDIIVATPEEKEKFNSLLKESIRLTP